MNNLKFNLTFLFLLVASYSYSIVGLTDWSATTPGGNEIYDFSNKTLRLKNGDELENIGKWYFYSGYIIGQPNFGGYLTNPKLYFVVNEQTYKIDTFSNQVDWKNFIESRGLQPKIWTRWYDNDWVELIDGILLFSFFYFYISLPLLFLLGIILYRAITLESFNTRKPYTLTSLFIFSLFLLVWLSEKFPQSI
ncbi:MAG TPA: hypothetical protein DIW47_09905 [Bacteroidetes bacterium]|nr:hypothetical protein [Bacteroidota bacterium]